MPLIIADSQYIETHILASVVVVNNHPTLQNLKATLTSIDADCGTCAGRQTEAERRKREVWNDIRIYLAMLPDSQKADLRQQLNLRSGDRLRVSFTTGTGNSSQVDAREI